MLNENAVRAVIAPKNELGMVICKVCSKVIHVLPTNGVKKIYGVCNDKTCIDQRTGGKQS